MAEVEVMKFERPEGEGKTLFVHGIPSSLPQEEKWAALQRAFSAFGLIYDINLPQSSPSEDTPPPPPFFPPPPAPPSTATEYGFVKFYSTTAAKTAQLETDRKLRIGGRIIGVELARSPSTPKPTPLHITRCHELCNHYIGFNQWNMGIKTMEELREEEEEGGREEGGREEGGKVVRFRCTVELTLRECGGVSVGTGEGRMEVEGNDMHSRLQARVAVRKMAYNRACEDAFSRVLIIIIPGKKVSAMIAQRPDDLVRQMLGELVCSCPPIHVLPQQPDHDTSNEETD